MAKTKAVTAKAAKPPKAEPPAELVLKLFAPGMTALHRAGLGGLACTLRYIERAYQREQNPLGDNEVPGGPWADGRPPWDIEPDRVVLRFGEAGKAADYLKRLYALGFALSGEPMIHLPAQHVQEPTAGIRADLQLGLTLTFLQHGLTRKLAPLPPTVAQHDPDGTGVPAVTVEYRACSAYRHQDDWKSLVDAKSGRLTTKPIAIEGPLNPGAVVRHGAFTADTKAEGTVEQLLSLHFALVGCVAVPVNRGVGVLVVPDVEDLAAFAEDRPYLTPSRPRDGLTAGGADAALQMQVRLKARNLGVTGCHAVTFRPTAWASQQKSRVQALYVPRLSGTDLDVYELALAHLAPRIVPPKEEKPATGRAKAKPKKDTGPKGSFRTDSVVRPLIADNLAVGRSWYAGFTRLMTATNPATDKPFRDAVQYEQEGLNNMIYDDKAWEDQERERLVVQAVHEAIRFALKKIKEEKDGKNSGPPSPATKNKWKQYRERLRITLTGAKTAAQTRFAMTKLYSRAGSHPVLQDGWTKVLYVLQEDWELARDLGLLGLASYKSRRPKQKSPDTNKENN